ncbi:2-hydroxyacid dehydrogenase [Anaerocolumna cellulosilytica]|uniref:2-hydroxyacid dehydrogenase n=1 Tax=Anaerocolumna cellulosilytica TaxID=433286 RepID=A0A6S6R8T8_9FIRM|nr:D-2-hydroxyacid dehydrogenase [Anaerocolumna cellulosilytica]MBB5196495.1 glycerate dehydrogenase [Anaerocolumna cellulosilytica]BCJ95595.1 2-hydroxyacid dehydrogenase [Anaerocolumna cellulosilytica]
MKIVFLETDTLGDDVDLNIFDEFGEVIKYNKSEPDKNAERAKDADILIVNKVPMNERTLKEAINLKLICITGTGTNIVDFPYTNERNIAVANVKGYSTQSVVQHTFALFFYLYEKLAFYDDFVKSGDYVKSDIFSRFDPKFNELHGKTWGIIGLGEIGKNVANIASTFGCQVQYYSTSGKNIDNTVKQVDFDTLLSSSDIVSIHAPLNERTENLIDASALKKMKSSAILLNLGRGPIVNEEDLADALDNGEIAAAGLDVIKVEPMAADNPLLRIKDSTKLLITPHIAWATIEARQRCVKEVHENVKAFLNQEARNIVKQ